MLLNLVLDDENKMAISEWANSPRLSYGFISSEFNTEQPDQDGETRRCAYTT